MKPLDGVPAQPLPVLVFAVADAPRSRWFASVIGVATLSGEAAMPDQASMAGTRISDICAARNYLLIRKV